MKSSAQEVMAQREVRNAAKDAFDARYGAIRADMEERGIAGRILDETVEAARGAFDEAVAVVEDNPAIVGGTLAALALWIFRNPLISWVETLLRLDHDHEEDTDNG
ncbi:hypothetical protein [Novosphingobium decolorationis]|uniref:DUF3618 domain-containing protein n=1 Tax=Novosphingobium decolorationis TaxID=2698673 RepID=A0ABX8E072_9SPHN|nr:hypothetical protein [Novosphingobium decolorationis]QVM82501.1 hypothetical protein HT578_01200 [Novosphingobium decolorationis]